MTKQWFQMKEQGAGEKRLVLSYYLYKIFGQFPLRIIALCVAMCVLLSSKERRLPSEKFYRILGKPPFISTVRQFVNYANSLVDKIISFSGNISIDKFVFDSDIKVFNNAFFITTHIGNAEILRSLLSLPNSKRSNIFMQKNACTIFNNFLNKIEKKVNIEIFPVEDICPEVAIIISERLKNGEIVFMAGDRISAQNENMTYEAEFFGQKIDLPLGTLKFALMLEVPIYFIVCAKKGKKYNVHIQKFQDSNNSKKDRLEALEKQYVEFLTNYTNKYPYQFYQFYDFWNKS